LPVPPAETAARVDPRTVGTWKLLINTRRLGTGIWRRSVAAGDN